MTPEHLNHPRSEEAQQFVFRQNPADIWKRKAPDLENNQIISDIGGRVLTLEVYHGDHAYILQRKALQDQIIQILGRCHRNCVGLCGENGVGKTDLLCAIAKEIVIQTIDPRFLDFQLVLLDLSAIMSFGSYKGGMVKALNLYYRDIVDKHQKVITCYDEAHTVLRNTSMDPEIEAVWKRELGSSKYPHIIVTDIQGYERVTAKDGGLSRRLDRVIVPSMTLSEVQELFEKTEKRQLERHYQIEVPMNLVSDAFKLAHENMVYRPGMPAAVVDLVDTALSIELRKNKAVNSGNTAPKLTLASLEEAARRSNGMDRGGLTKRERLKRVQGLESLKSRFPGLESHIDTIKGILEKKYQSEPGLTILFFAGPTGTGKTELARSIAKILDPDALLEINGTQYNDAWGLSTLLGSWPGLIHSDRPSLLSRQVRSKPYSLILFDEADKAHSEILNLLLQISNKGNQALDRHGVKMDFSRAILILTSNAGFHVENGTWGFKPAHSEGPLPQPHDENLFHPGLLKERLKKTFAGMEPFINRLQTILQFRYSDSDLLRIFRFKIGGLEEKYGIRIRLNRSTEEKLIGTNACRGFGVRAIEDYISNLDDFLNNKNVLAGECVSIIYKQNRISLKRRSSGKHQDGGSKSC
jgi:ATP-dependent Clp protease ATP-binding subunit ClpA